MQELSIQAYDMNSFCKAFSIGRTKAYEEVKSGRLKTLKVGRRTIITAKAADNWLTSLENSN